MTIRGYQAEDKEALEQMHRKQGFAYSLPDLDDPSLWISRDVLLDGAGKPAQAILGRLTAEAYFLDSGEASAHVRIRRFLALHRRACERGKAAGMDSVHVWLPPEIKETFGRQLEKLGWVEYVWPTYMKALEA